MHSHCSRLQSFKGETLVKSERRISELNRERLAGPSPNVVLLKKVAQYVEGMLQVIGITTIGLHFTEELTASAKELLAIFQHFKDSIATAPELKQVGIRLLGSFLCHPESCLV